MFLTWKRVLTLEEAASKLTSNETDSQKLKTKIRRLYDIANVFKSLGLIVKTHVSKTKKPAFEWIGVEGIRANFEFDCKVEKAENIFKCFDVFLTKSQDTKTTPRKRKSINMDELSTPDFKQTLTVIV